MNFIGQYFTNSYLDALLKKVKEKLDVKVIDNRDTISIARVIPNKGEAQLNINSDCTEITLVKDSCKMLLKKHVIDGYLIVTMQSLGFDNSIENFRENAKTLLTFADFVDIAKEVFEKTK